MLCKNEAVYSVFRFPFVFIIREICQVISTLASCSRSLWFELGTWNILCSSSDYLNDSMCLKFPFRSLFMPFLIQHFKSCYLFSWKPSFNKLKIIKPVFLPFINQQQYARQYNIYIYLVHSLKIFRCCITIFRVHSQFNLKNPNAIIKQVGAVTL